MNKLKLSFSDVCISLREGSKFFWSTVLAALAKNFNAKFLTSVSVILVIAAILSSIILSFMHSTRLGWWCLASWAALCISLVVALLVKDKPKEQLWLLIKIIAGIVAAVGLCISMGWFIDYLLPPAKPMNITLEGYLLFGVVINGLLAICCAALVSNYKDGKKASRWQNPIEYIVHLLRILTILAIGIAAIYLLVHYLKPLVI